MTLSTKHIIIRSLLNSFGEAKDDDERVYILWEALKTSFDRDEASALRWVLGTAPKGPQVGAAYIVEYALQWLEKGNDHALQYRIAEAIVAIGGGSERVEGGLPRGPAIPRPWWLASALLPWVEARRHRAREWNRGGA